MRQEEQMMERNLEELPITKQGKTPVVNYIKDKHGSLLADSFTRGDKIVCGKGDNQVIFNPVDEFTGQQSQSNPNQQNTSGR